MAARWPANGGDPRDKGPLRGSRRSKEARSRGTKKRRDGTPKGGRVSAFETRTKEKGSRRSACHPPRSPRGRKEANLGADAARGKENGCAKNGKTSSQKKKGRRLSNF